MSKIILLVLACFFIPDYNNQIVAGHKPILPDFHADPSARQWADRYWIYPSTDEPDSKGWNEMKRWHCYSSTDLVNWKNHGEIFSLDKITWANKAAYAPDCMERNGKYYFYFPADYQIGVAVSDNPDGPFVDVLGKPLVTKADGKKCETRAMDPCIFIDDNNQAYLFFAGGKNVGVVELNEDMISTKNSVRKLELEHCAEGIWIHKYKGLYYFSYPRHLHDDKGNITQDLVYSTAENIYGPYTFRGQILETGGRNVQHSIVRFAEQWYLFYHIEGPSPYERRVCVDYLYYNDDDTIKAVKTSVPEKGWNLTRNIISLPGDAVHTWGGGVQRKVFFDEFLPAVFHRKLAFDSVDTSSTVQWILTGQRGGLTLELRDSTLKVIERHYDSVGFGLGSRHPEQNQETLYSLTGQLRSLSVILDGRASLTVQANGKPLHKQTWLTDIQRHQLYIRDSDAEFRARLFVPALRDVHVRAYPDVTFQTIEGFGGIASMPTYRQFSEKGKRLWWKILCEYNLLIQREYPNGVHLKEDLSNMDRMEDAVPHYYGDNFPNSEISDFGYLKTLRQIPDSVVWYEFWALPPWAVENTQKYAEAMLGYCRQSKKETGYPPNVVGIQNEIMADNWREQALVLRAALDKSGLAAVKIHSNNSSKLNSGLSWIKKYRETPEAWDVLDYTASNMYDYQEFFENPDGFDHRLVELRKQSGDKPFLSTELAINDSDYQYPSYRMAFQMAQLYHKNLVLANAAAVAYCWLLLDVEQPSYGWTRALLVPDRHNGFVPTASSFQLRTFGAYSRRIHRGMKRIDIRSDNADLLVSAYQDGDRSTVVLLNRSVYPMKTSIECPRFDFKYAETVSPYQPHRIHEISSEIKQVIVESGSILTLSNVPLKTLPDDFMME